MKNPVRLTVLAVLAATVAAGCGTSNPMGPSFARTAPPAETAVSQAPLTEEPGVEEPGTGSGADFDAVDAEGERRVKKERKAHPVHPTHPEHP